MRIVHLSPTILPLLSLLACSGPSSITVTDPDMQFGHRYAGTPPDGYGTVSISEPAEGQAFAYLPATFHRVIVRPDLSQPEQDTVAVEILVKGSLPDACTELHAFEQQRAGNIITGTLRTRRPRSAMCATARRPYRFYLMLEGSFVHGHHYTLKLNDSVIPFSVQENEAE